MLQLWPQAPLFRHPRALSSGSLPLQVLHGDSPSRILVRDTHAQNFDYDAGHTGLLCDRWRDLSADQRTIEQVGKACAQCRFDLLDGGT